MDEKLTIFIAVTSAAVVLQMLTLLGMYLALRKLGPHINSVANEVKSQVFPLLESGKHLLSDIKRILETSSPKVELVLDNAAAITTTRIVKKVVRRTELLKGHRHGFRFQACS